MLDVVALMCHNVFNGSDNWPSKMTTKQNMIKAIATQEHSWVEFTVHGPVDVVRYRTTHDAQHLQYWSEHRVPGFARQGWNTTTSETVALRARAALKAKG